MTIELTDYEAELFLKFRENQDLLTHLDGQGLFDMVNGSIRIDYGLDGQVKVETSRWTKVR